jgi:alkylation response protein AidB-like acyl-CoA dehydrogenase
MFRAASSLRVVLTRHQRTSLQCLHEQAKAKYLSTAAESDTVTQEVIPAPITHFTQDENMTRDAARQWAQEELKPIVRDMDNEGQLRPEVVQSLFDCGFMGMVS